MYIDQQREQVSFVPRFLSCQCVGEGERGWSGGRMSHQGARRSERAGKESEGSGEESHK